MGIRVLSGVHFLEVLAYLLPLCNEDTSPVTPALIISGCDSRYHREMPYTHVTTFVYQNCEQRLLFMNKTDCFTIQENKRNKGIRQQHLLLGQMLIQGLDLH